MLDGNCINTYLDLELTEVEVKFITIRQMFSRSLIIIQFNRMRFSSTSIGMYDISTRTIHLWKRWEMSRELQL